MNGESNEEIRKRLEHPISTRIAMYEHMFLYGCYEFPQQINNASRSFKEEEKQAYVLYRLKLEEYERKEIGLDPTG